MKFCFFKRDKMLWCYCVCGGSVWVVVGVSSFTSTCVCCVMMVRTWSESSPVFSHRYWPHCFAWSSPLFICSCDSMNWPTFCCTCSTLVVTVVWMFWICSPNCSVTVVCIFWNCSPSCFFFYCLNPFVLFFVLLLQVYIVLEFFISFIVSLIFLVFHQVLQIYFEQYFWLPLIYLQFHVDHQILLP